MERGRGRRPTRRLVRLCGMKEVLSALRPLPAGGGIFKRRWLRYFQPRGANLPPVVASLPDGTQMSIIAIEAPHHVDESIQSWDCAFKDLDTSDYVVGQVWARLARPSCRATRSVPASTARVLFTRA